MIDRETLERAAQATGCAYRWSDHLECIMLQRDEGYTDGCWLPDVNSSDALTLAVDLGLSIEPYPYNSTPKHSVIVKQRRGGDVLREGNPTEVIEQYGDDPVAATRRAIVRSAALVGQGQ